MSVTIRMKRMGRKNRAFYRICASDKRSPRDGRVIEELGTYDPFVPETDARCVLNGPRVQYWLSVGAQPSNAVRVLIKKYGPSGTHEKAMELARAKLSLPRVMPDPGPPAYVPEVKVETSAESTTELQADTAVAEVIAVEAVAEGSGAGAEAPATEESAGS